MAKVRRELVLCLLVSVAVSVDGVSSDSIANTITRSVATHRESMTVMKPAFLQQRQGPSACIASGRTAFTGTFDVVITWYVQKHQSSLYPVALASSGKNVSSSSRLQAQIENNNEIAYLLCGMDQFGMLPYVGKIFIVLDRNVVNAYGAPRNVNWDHPKIHPIYTQDLGILGHSSINAKLATFHHIPGISEWFLYLQDDIFVANSFSMDLLFDGSKPRIWLKKDLYVTPSVDCPGGPIDEGPDHLAWLVNRCYMEEVEREYSVNFNSVKTDNSNLFKATCTYDSWMNRHALTSLSYDPGNHYGAVCHLGGQWSQCPIGTNGAGAQAIYALEHVLAHPPVFLNLQGWGISDEYTSDYAVNAKTRQWLHQFYKKSDLTIAQWD